jgi:hypothetical protein
MRIAAYAILAAFPIVLLGGSLWSTYRFVIRLAERCMTEERSPNATEKRAFALRLGLVVLGTGLFVLGY